MGKIRVDFTGTDEGGAVHVPPGYYKMRIVEARLGKAKSSGNNVAEVKWLIMGPNKTVKKSMPLIPNSLWKLRQMLIACGYQVPAKAVTIDTDAWKGRECGALLVDSEYTNSKGEKKVSSDIDEFVTLAEYEALRGNQAATNGAKSPGQAAAAVEEAISEDEISSDDLTDLDSGGVEGEETDDLELVEEDLPF